MVSSDRCTSLQEMVMKSLAKPHPRNTLAWGRCALEAISCGECHGSVPSPFPGGCQMGPTLVRRVLPRSDLAISCWKAHGWLVWAVHEDDGSRDVSARVSLGARKSTHFCLEDRWRALAPSTIGPASRLVPLLFLHYSRTCKLSNNSLQTP